MPAAYIENNTWHSAQHYLKGCWADGVTCECQKIVCWEGGGGDACGTYISNGCYAHATSQVPIVQPPLLIELYIITVMWNPRWSKYGQFHIISQIDSFGLSSRHLVMFSNQWKVLIKKKAVNVLWENGINSPWGLIHTYLAIVLPSHLIF